MLVTADAVTSTGVNDDDAYQFQRVVLSSAAVRDDHAAVLPAGMKAAALKVGASLVARKLMREARAKAGMPVWRDDGEGRGVALVITNAGLGGINASDDHKQATELSLSLPIAFESKIEAPEAGRSRAKRQGEYGRRAELLLWARSGRRFWRRPSWPNPSERR